MNESVVQQTSHLMLRSFNFKASLYICSIITSNSRMNHSANKAITQSLSEFECLNYDYHQSDSPSPLGRVAHRSKALDAYSITGSLNPVSNEFCLVSQAAPRDHSNACSLPPSRGIAQVSAARDRYRYLGPDPDCMCQMLLVAYAMQRCKNPLRTVRFHSNDNK